MFNKVVTLDKQVLIPCYLENRVEILSFTTSHMSDEPTKLIITKFATMISIILVEKCLDFLITKYAAKLG